MWRKTATATESGSYSFGQDNHGAIHVVCLRDASTAVNVAITEGVALTAATPGVAPADASAVEIRAAAVYTFPTTITGWSGAVGVHAARAGAVSECAFVGGGDPANQLLGEQW
ncbi:hypothetical protein [Streptosporangium vulgare]|uniref:hypothetical protein n=1 Tax=Streptosporangium vulgare TaxID=46190 RepID=UPI0031E45714